MLCDMTYEPHFARPTGVLAERAYFIIDGPWNLSAINSHCSFNLADANHAFVLLL